MYKKVVLDNNLKLILAPLSESRSVTVSIYVKAGSRFEDEKSNGIAHFLEHLAFKGSKKYPSQLELSKLVEGMGANWNASTDTEIIKYYIRAESSKLSTIVDVLDQMLFHSLYDVEDIEREKGVIIEEINMYNDMPESRVSQLVDEITWPKHPLGRNIAGSKETVSSFTQGDFITYQQRFFTPNNIVIGISGKFDQKEAIELMKKHFGDLKPSEDPRYEWVSAAQALPVIAVESKDTEQAHMCMNFRTFARSDERRFALNLLSMILGGGISSRLFQKIRTELGLAYYVNCSSDYYLDTGIFQVSAGVNNIRTRQAIVEILNELNLVLKDGVTNEELQRNKDYLKGILAISLEDHQKLNSFLSSQELMLGAILSYEELIKKIDAVDKEDVLNVADLIFKNNNLNLAVVGKVEENTISDVATF